ncbi:MAG: pyridoxal 5'-phosphate synthase glutaminase subunit PdxT [Desulfurococcales archaeon]|nr:pyridoxal 5'-phosphate synthase glutaminase subunit PdxT [Desulfurococcales archaeon]
MVKIGVLALQGDFLEHIQILREIEGVEPVTVKRIDDLKGVDALVIPGGESTTIGLLLSSRGLDTKVVELAEKGLPIMGTCAGAILLAAKVADRVVGETNQFTLKLMNIEVVRNIFGRQRESFITTVRVENIGLVKGAFIRAPGIKSAWPPARVTGYINHPSIGEIGVAAEQNNMLALTFHPEITGEKGVYKYFLSFIKR